MREEFAADRRRSRQEFADMRNSGTRQLGLVSFPLLTLPAFRAALERCGCRWSLLTTFSDGPGEGTLYTIERGEGDDLEFAVIHVWNEIVPVPLDVIRSVCMALHVGPERLRRTVLKIVAQGQTGDTCGHAVRVSFVPARKLLELLAIWCRRRGSNPHGE